jgi:multidrug resistance efflux pump
LDTKKSIPKWTIVLAAAVVVALVVIFVVLFGKKEEPAKKEEKVYKVSVIEVGAMGNDVELTYTGIVQPEETEQATFSSIGTVNHVYVTEGQQVKAGDVLATMDDTEARRQVENNANSLKIAQTNLDTAIKQRDRAYEDYREACGAGNEKEALDNAVERRDEQTQKVDELSSDMVTAEAEQTRTKDEYDQARNALVSAQSDYATKSAELDMLKKDPGASQEDIDKKEAELSEADNKVNEARATHETKQTEYTQAQINYRAKQTELDAAQSTLTTYNEGVDSAQEAYDNKLEKGAESREAKAQKEVCDTADNSVTSSQATYDSAKNNYDSAVATLEDYTLRAKSDGYVIQVGVTEGGMANPIMPAVVLGSNRCVVNFGVSQSDIRDIHQGLGAKIAVNGVPFDGYVGKIGLMPDETSRTYSTDVVILTEDDFYLGELATVKINIGARQGIWLPLSVILNDGEDYVYLVEDGRAKRQNVVIEEINNDMVMVSGLGEGNLVISEGMKLVKTGSAVSYEKNTAGGAEDGNGAVGVTEREGSAAVGAPGADE